jgi:hypothetical protein
VNLTDDKGVTVQKVSRDIANVELFAGDEELKRGGLFQDGSAQTYYFRITSSPPEVTIKLTLWKNIKEQTVIFGNDTFVQGEKVTEEKTTSQKATGENASKFSVMRMETNVIAEVPEDLSWNVKPSLGFSGDAAKKYGFSYFITGANMIRVKQDSLVVTKLQLRDGTDISKTSDGTPAYKLREGTSWASEKYARVDIDVKSDTFVATEIPAIEGSVVIVTAEETETKTLTFKTDDTEPQTVGEYTVQVIQYKERFAVKVTGVRDGISALELVAGDQKERSHGGGTEGPNILVGFFEKPLTPEVTVNLVLWKGVKEHTVAFEN